MQASMLEIYKEEYRDLLGPGPPAGKKHQVRLHAPQHLRYSAKDVYGRRALTKQHVRLRAPSAPCRVQGFGYGVL